MEQQNTEHPDEINLYDLWKVIVKRKRLIIGLFIAFVILTIIISSHMPKVYRGEAVLMVQPTLMVQPGFMAQTVLMPTANITAKDIVDFVGKIDEEKRAKRLPNTYASITDIQLKAFKESKDKIAVIIEAKDTNAIQPALMELIEYIKTIDLVKQNAKEEQERLLKHSTELSTVIAASSGLLDTYKKLLTEGKLLPVGFNPVELNKRISDIKLEKLQLEQAIQRLKGGIEIASHLYVGNNPVKPRIIMIVALSGITSLFLGIFLSFFLEYVERIKKGNIS